MTVFLESKRNNNQKAAEIWQTQSTSAGDDKSHRGADKVGSAIPEAIKCFLTAMCTQRLC